MVGRAGDGTREQVSDACLKNRVGLETDRVLVTLGFQELIEVRRGEGRIASEVAPHLPIPITGNHGFQNVVPAMGAMDVAGAQGAPLQIAKLVEHKQRMIAGTPEVPVVGRALLIAVGWAHTGIHVEDDHPRRVPRMHAVDPLP